MTLHNCHFFLFFGRFVDMSIIRLGNFFFCDNLTKFLNSIDDQNLLFATVQQNFCNIIPNLHFNTELRAFIFTNKIGNYQLIA
jgi:hypothetical protein